MKRILVWLFGKYDKKGKCRYCGGGTGNDGHTYKCMRLFSGKPMTFDEYLKLKLPKQG